MKRLILAYCFLFFWLFAFGQSEKMRFEFMFNEGANSSGMVMTEDFQGNLWGFFNSILTRFDGTNWTKYQHDPEDPCSIPLSGPRQIGWVYPGTHKDLWISTSIGLIRLDLTTDCFTTFFSHWDSLQIVDIGEDSNGNLWLLEAKKGLIKIKVRELLEKTANPDSIKYQVFPYQFLKKPGPGLMESIQILPDTKRGGLWLASLYGLGYFDPGKEKFSIYQPTPDTSSIPNPSNVIHHIFKDSRGILWLGTRSAGLIRFDPGSKKFDFFYPYGKDHKDPRDNIVITINEIDDGRLILSVGYGYLQRLKLFDPVSHQFIAIDGNYRIDKNSNQASYRHMFKDRFGNLWIINDFFWGKFNSDNNQFAFFDINNRPNSIKGNFSLAVCPDRQGNLYIGSDTHLNYLDRATGEVSYFSVPPGNKSGLSSGVDAIIEDRSGMVWVGTTNDGLNRFDPKTKTFKQYLIPDKNATWVCALYEDSKGILWVGTQGPGKLFQFDRKQEKFILISEDRQLWWAGLRSFAETKSGDLWISSNGGLVFFDRKRNTLTKAPLKIPEKYSSGLHGILLDKNKKLWICAVTGPIFKYDPVSQNTYSYEHISAFQDNKVRSIALDRHGMLWITSGRGMIHFDPDSGKLIRLYASDIWLQPGQSWDSATMDLARSKKGEIVVQGYSGVLVFHPDSVRINTVPPNVVITGLRFQEGETKRKGRNILPRVISEAKAIRLPYHANDFSIDYVGIHLKNPKSNQYAYRLAPLEKDWQEVGTLRQAKYTNLAPGQYTFQVKASNSDGVWNEEGATLRITILPPWYWAWWSKTLYLLALLGALYLIRQQELKKQEQKLAVEQEKLGREILLNARLRQIDQLKDQFLANTSHELRTPLHGIVGIAESLFGQVEEKSPGELRQNLGMIMASGRRLTSLVNDLLDFSRAKNHDLQLRPESIDLHALTEVVLQSCRPLLGASPVELRNEIPKEGATVLADSNRLQQILYNLVGNAIKFTREGYVKVGVKSLGVEELRSLEGGQAPTASGASPKLLNRADEVRPAKLLTCFVEDTGIGIPADKHEAIFRSFEQADGDTAREYGGAGLGLSITRQLVELHGGTIWVESEPDKGARFFFTLPVSDQPTQLSPQADEPAVASAKAEPEKPVATLSPFSIPITALSPTAGGPGEADRIRVLVVDDEPINHQVLRNYLGGDRYLITSVMSGREALEAIELGVRFDLVLLDVMMPRMSGYEVCRKIREKHLPSELPVIMVTAKNQVQDLVEGLGVGANDYLAKPFSRDEFLARVQTQLDLHRIFNVAGKFVPNEFIHALGRERITDVQLGDQTTREVTVLFSDIRDYTTLSEAMLPGDIFGLVNAYNCRMGPVIQANRGFVNQYQGDAIMAIFPTSPADALQAAVDMQRALHQYNRERAAKKRQLIHAGMGLHTGKLIMGIIGDEHRMDAATIADTVNTTSRIESLTKHFGASILLSGESRQGIGENDAFHLRYLGKVRVKGKLAPTELFECFDGDEPSLREHKLTSLAAFHAAMEQYHARAFAEAVLEFNHIAKAHAGDQVARYFFKKASRYAHEGVADDWTGVEVMEVK